MTQINKTLLDNLNGKKQIKRNIVKRSCVTTFIRNALFSFVQDYFEKRLQNKLLSIKRNVISPQ